MLLLQLKIEILQHECFWREVIEKLEEENRRQKHMYAELSLDHRIFKDIVEK